MDYIKKVKELGDANVHYLDNHYNSHDIFDNRDQINNIIQKLVDLYNSLERIPLSDKTRIRIEEMFPKADFKILVDKIQIIKNFLLNAKKFESILYSSFVGFTSFFP